MRATFPLALFLSVLMAQSVSAQEQSILPHIANGSFPGGSFRTTFIIVNNTDWATTAVLRLSRDDGDPLTVTIPGLGTGSSFDVTLAPGATRVLQTDGGGNLVQGAATISSSAALGASAVFTMFDPQGNFRAEAGTGDSPLLAQFTLPVDDTGTFSTGIALFNPSASAITLNLRLLDAEGNVVGTAPLTLPPGNHTARFVSEIFHAGTCTSSPDCAGDLQGSIAVTATDAISALVLRQNVVAGIPTYTSLPITPGVSQGKVPPALLSKSETGVAVQSDTTLNASLRAGLTLTGTVTPAVFAAGAEVSAQSGNNVYSGSVDARTGKYVIVLPAGFYNLSARYTVYTKDQGLDATRVAVTANAGSVQISGNTVKDVSLAGVSLFSVSGTVSGLGMLPTDPAGRSNILFISEDSRMTGFFPLDEATGTWEGKLPPGTFMAGISVVSASHTTSYYSIGFLTVGGGPATGSFAVPPTAGLSGTLRVAVTPAPGVTTQVFAIDSGGWSSRAAPDAAGNYRMIVANHRSYTVGVSTYSTAASLFASTAEIHVTGDMSLDISVPAPPATVTLSGKVTDPGGGAVPNAIVIANSKSVAGFQGVSLSQRAETDAGGNYSMKVPGGSYDVTFSPGVSQ